MEAEAGARVPRLAIGAEREMLVPPIPFVAHAADRIPGVRFALLRGASRNAPRNDVATLLEMTTTFIETDPRPRAGCAP